MLEKIKFFQRIRFATNVTHGNITPYYKRKYNIIIS